MKRAIILILALSLAGVALAQQGVKKKRPLPYEYGRVVMNNNTEKMSKDGLAPVVFDHWLHRAMFSCRLCHVDIGFAMKTGATGVKASDNAKGYYCGSCHNGKMLHTDSKGQRAVFMACSNVGSSVDARRCDRCHSLGKNVLKEYEFETFTGKFPKERFGNGIDWEQAEVSGLIRIVDVIEGISIQREKLAVQKDFALSAKAEGMPEIVFSHKKHTIWSGCEGCHPEIFVGVKKGLTKYSMVEIYDGKYCGACHGKVAFPLLDCQRCHTKPVS